jgi:hypothetical protein
MSTMTTAGTAAFSSAYYEPRPKNQREVKVYEYRESHLAYFDRGIDVAPPRKTSWGALADLGPAPSAEDIAEMRREVWGKFPREDI